MLVDCCTCLSVGMMLSWSKLFPGSESLLSHLLLPYVIFWGVFFARVSLREGKAKAPKSKYGGWIDWNSQYHICPPLFSCLPMIFFHCYCFTWLFFFSSRLFCFFYVPFVFFHICSVFLYVSFFSSLLICLSFCFIFFLGVWSVFLFVRFGFLAFAHLLSWKMALNCPLGSLATASKHRGVGVYLLS